ncbi:MAG: sterol desaturase family protein [Methylococcaceae bacterium]|nr:sterol desaturase family protein [Methylococcaceae bacterium]
MSDLMLHFMIGFPLGLLAENAGEWLMHRYVLHHLGKKPGSIWGYHWHEHHRVCRENGMVDPGYRELPLRWNTQGKEAAFLLLALLIHAPLWWLIPGYVAGLYFALIGYYLKHRKAHLDPDWAKNRLPWHYDHHMGNNPDANWCISWPWFDDWMKTRDQ